VYLILQSYRQFRWRPFVIVASFSAAGLPLGMMLYDLVPEDALKTVLAAFLIIVGCHGLWAQFRAPAEPAAQAGEPHPAFRVFLFLGGVIQGAFAAGGPMIVVYASKALPDKGLFRATLCPVWLCLNTILIAKWTFCGDVWTRDIGLTVLAAVPFVAVGMVLGNRLHHRVNESAFRVIVNAALALSGLFMFYFRIRGAYAEPF